MKKKTAIKLAEALHDENIAIIRMLCIVGNVTDDQKNALLSEYELRFQKTVKKVLYEE